MREIRNIPKGKCLVCPVPYNRFGTLVGCILSGGKTSPHLCVPIVSHHKGLLVLVATNEIENVISNLVGKNRGYLLTIIDIDVTVPKEEVTTIKLRYAVFVSTPTEGDS